MSSAEGVGLWRVFPWDASAPARERFSASYVPPPSGRGRFDLPPRLSRVAYLAESPEHAVAEVIQPWRGGRIGPAHLRRAGLPLALVGVTLRTQSDSLADLCRAEVLLRLEVEPDRTASRARAVTQPIARKVWDEGYAGLRWWSSFQGDWHTRVLFMERADGTVRFDKPELLEPAHPAVRSAAEMLGIRLSG